MLHEYSRRCRYAVFVDFEISAINDADEKNYRLVREGLSDAAYYPDAVLGVYATLHSALAPFLTSDQQKHAAALIFGQCIKHLVVGTNNLFRGQAGVMYRETRGAIESVGIAYRITAHEPTLKAYMADREHDKKARRAFRNLTGSDMLFPKGAPQSIRMMKIHYAHASQKAHTNRMNFLRNVAYSAEQGTSEMNLRDFTQENLIPKLPVELGWMCIMHLAILLAAADIFVNTGAEMEPYIDLQNEVQNILGCFMLKYVRLADPDSAIEDESGSHA